MDASLTKNCVKNQHVTIYLRFKSNMLVHGIAIDTVVDRYVEGKYNKLTMMIDTISGRSALVCCCLVHVIQNLCDRPR